MNYEILEASNSNFENADQVLKYVILRLKKHFLFHHQATVVTVSRSLRMTSL
jgi:hypothetical protein